MLGTGADGRPLGRPAGHSLGVSRLACRAYRIQPGGMETIPLWSEPSDCRGYVRDLAEIHPWVARRYVPMCTGCGELVAIALADYLNARQAVQDHLDDCGSHGGWCENPIIMQADDPYS